MATLRLSTFRSETDSDNCFQFQTGSDPTKKIPLLVKLTLERFAANRTQLLLDVTKPVTMEASSDQASEEPVVRVDPVEDEAVVRPHPAGEVKVVVDEVCQVLVTSMNLKSKSK